MYLKDVNIKMENEVATLQVCESYEGFKDVFTMKGTSV